MAVIEIPSGEIHKTYETYLSVMGQLTQLQADRGTVLINLGGGVVCDLGGFAAATYKRGIRYINVPTTLLAMADAATGGKTGIDFLNYKNLIGAFHQPLGTFIYADFLETLPTEHLLSGLGEIIKTCLIANANLFSQLSTDLLNDISRLAFLAERAAEFKHTIVEQDPTEQNVRQIFNFGHTFGHCFESFFLSSGQPITHGHAVAMGMLCETMLSVRYLGLSKNTCDQINNLILKYFSPIAVQSQHFETLWQIMQHDKKNSHQEVHCVLLKAIGAPKYNQIIDKDAVFSAFQYYQSLSKAPL
ncbi:3-dehydroquinate synthase [Bacteroidia bacterium]|nr:3-dehydroquinate synthase [Bacteroidia bacterium]